MDFFFYGTLMDARVRAAVLGRPLAAARLRPATVKGFRRVRMAGAPYPVLVAGAADDRVDGLLACGLSAGDAARLVRYEGTAYVVKTLPVDVATDRTVAARVFMPRRRVRATAEPWTLADWQHRRRRASRAA